MATSSLPASSLLALAERNAALHPDRLAFAGPTDRYTWAALLSRAGAVATAMERHRLAPGDRVCLCLPSAPVWVVAFLALRRLGLTAVSIGDQPRPAELQALSSRFDIRLLLTNGHRASATAGDAPVLDVASVTGAPPPKPRRHDAALIHLTSGSSGAPKGVLRTEADLTEEACNVAAALRLAPGDAVLCATPVFHSFASGLLTASMHAGVPCLLMDRLAPATLLETARRHCATVIAGVPYVFQTLIALTSNETLPSLRLAASGGAHLSSDTAARFEARFGARLVQEYGLSEAGIVTLNLDGPAGSVGAPIPNVELSIVDAADPSRELPQGATGEVVVRRASPPAGYLDHPMDSRGTFTPYGIRSGDLGCLDEAGRLTLTGRIKAMINVAGAKVAPREVEDALLTHPNITEAVAFALPDAFLGEAVAAVVVPNAGAAVTEQALREHCRGLLSVYKVPAVIRVAKKLPRTVSGKPDLPRIRSEFAPRRYP